MTLPIEAIETCINWAHGFEIVENAHELAVHQLDALLADNKRLRAENREWYERDKRGTV